MKIAIMQPYFFPYVGYFQLINCVDKFVILNDVQYIKRGWINRNKYLFNNNDEYFTIPVKKFSQKQNILEIKIAKKYDKEKFMRQLFHAYQKAPFFDQTNKFLTKIIMFPSQNLFEYVYFSISSICKYLNVKTKILISSNIYQNNSLKSENRIIDICKSLNGTIYINPEGGIKIYKKNNFKKFKLNLKFLHTKDFKYQQFDEKIFIPRLSIIDLLMFNSKKKVEKIITSNFILK